MPLSRVFTITDAPAKTVQRAKLFGARLQRLPGSLGKHPGLLFSPGLEGYRDYAFGARSGPSIKVRHLFHELGHAAQFGPDQFRERANPDGYIFKMPTIFIAGRFCDEPTTSQATDRELDTFAHELHLLRAAGIKVHTDEHVRYCASIMRHMPDWWVVPGGSGSARHQECMNRLYARYEALTQAEVLDKLTAWLDATRHRIKRNAKRAYRPVELRFRTDGSLMAA